MVLWNIAHVRNVVSSWSTLKRSVSAGSAESGSSEQKSGQVGSEVGGQVGSEVGSEVGEKAVPAVSLTIRKFALLISCNYKNVAGASLNGCGNDSLIMEAYLRRRGFEYISVLTDDKPTATALARYRPGWPSRSTILTEIAAIIKRANAWVMQSAAKRAAQVVIHYSGHGDQTRDRNGDELTGLDQTILPNDFRSAGVIVDDDLKRITVDQLQKGVSLLLISDSCHSGTILDLPAFSGRTPTQINKTIPTTTPWCVSLSGCRDNQTSADAYLADYGRIQGAMTGALVAVLNRNDPATLNTATLLTQLQAEVRRRRFSQVPQLGLLKTVQPTDTCFPLL